MFEYFSERARQVIFLSQKNAGQRGVSAMGVEDLIEALVQLDQDRRVSFFSKNAAAKVLRMLAPLFQSGEPLPETAEIAVSPALQDVLTTAMGLRTELQHESVQPLHLLAAVLSEESDVAEAVKRAGVTREAVLAALGPALPLPDSASGDLPSRRTRPPRRW
jgi:ATP-dependent Clp protease ATP-binding subunit ClpA